MKDNHVSAGITALPLTHPQKRICSVEALFPGSPLHNIGGVVRIEGLFDPQLMNKAIQLFVSMHEGIRGQLVQEGSELKQVVADVPRPNEQIAAFWNFTGETSPEESFEEWVRQQAAIPFRLTGGPLYVFALCAIRERSNAILIKLHHVIADGWSVALLTGQLWAIYGSLRTGKERGMEGLLPDPAPIEIRGSHLQDAITQENRYKASHRFEQDRRFWLERFHEMPEFPLRSASDLSGKRRSFQLSEALSDAARNLISRTSSSLNLLFIALYYVYLNRMEGEEQVVIGTPVLNRSGALQKQTFGMFTGTMPFRFAMCDEWSFAELLSRIQDEMKLCYKHHRYPYDLLLQDLHANGWHQKALFDTSINCYNTRHLNEAQELSVSNTEFYSGEQWYALQWIVREWSADSCLSLDMDYQTAAYSDDEIEKMYVLVCRILEQAAQEPELPVYMLNLLSPEEENWQMHKFNDTARSYPKELTITERIEQQARSAPLRVAVTSGSDKLTYGELDTRASCLANRLISKGAGRGQVIGLYMNHSIETVIAILAVLKSDSAYLPLDAALPEERLVFMAHDAGVQMIVTNREDTFSFPGEWIMAAAQLPENEHMNADAASEVRTGEGHPDDLAYIIYTSGSTGRPKGTLIRHQALVNYIEWAAKTYVRGECEIFALYSSLAFDLTVTSIFTPLVSGGTIAVYPDHGEGHALYRIVKDNEVTILKLTPSHLSLLKGMDLRGSSIRRLIVGGEDFKSSLAAAIDHAWGGDIEIMNEYGPTEATVGCMIYTYDRHKDQAGSLPIGIPADNVQIYVLDERLRLRPPGAVGEIYIAGDGLAEGYLNRPEATAAHFLPHPFEPGKRIYKTGDLGRFRPDGQLEYKNRADSQLSMRGYRIEPGEVENALLAHPSVSEAAVTAVIMNGSSPQLCAYLVMSKREEREALRSFLAQRLPVYMIPQHYVFLDELPMTRNGKLDRARLPEPSVADPVKQGSRSITSEPVSAAAAALHEVLAEILEQGDIGSGDHFYHLGGDSIKAIQAVSLLQGRGYVIAANDILSNPLIGDMEPLIREKKRSSTRENRCTGSLPDTPMHVWFKNLFLDQPQQYHQRLLLEIRRPLSGEDIGALLDGLIRQHDTLRINQEQGRGRFFYNENHYSIRYSVHELGMESGLEGDTHAEIQRVADMAERKLDLAADPLMQALIFYRNGTASYLLLTAHHVIIDGVSWRIVLEDLNRAANQRLDGRDICLPDKTTSYQNWAESLHRQSDLIYEQEQSYWERVLGEAAPVLTSQDYTSVERAGQQQTERLYFVLAADATQQLLTTANRAYSTRPMELMLVGLLAAIRAVTGQRNISLDLEGHGREQMGTQMDLSRTVGWFTSLYPISIQSLHTEWGDLIKQVKEHLRHVPKGGGGYGVLRYLRKSLPESPPNDLVFNYLGEFAKGRDDDIFVLADDLHAMTSSRSSDAYAMEFNGGVFDRKLTFEVSCRTGESITGLAKSLMERFHACLLEVTEYCSRQTSAEFTPSDFESVELTQSELDSIFS
ncbi:amino acid adenylation domain-containing protein [Paenibacillus sp. P96]|uniref:Amino acid adenylation domain-containing protein n=1 Tax=Paenibacillus zeirhizosphaerae TaxID=2987519 RepID=A0ABT9FVT5_9BACL|nr:non-ribosomal peptide synthetase [Paenibacillus sp. P96]MDP4098848.1 amino acid adenylation domain-containing protein [Paenibacillus sp. P96]